MNLSRTLLYPALLAAAVSLPALVSAQGAPPPSAGPGQMGRMHMHGPHRHRPGMLHRAMRGVNLSAQQREQIQGLIRQFHQAHPKGSPRDPQAARQLHAAILNVLTPQQRAQFEANVKTLREHRREHRKERRERHHAMVSPSPSPQR